MLITRDEKCLIRCVFREEMGGREERRRRPGEEVVSFRLSLRGREASRDRLHRSCSVLYKTGTLKK